MIRPPEKKPEYLPLGCVVGCLPLELAALRLPSRVFQPCAWCCPEAALQPLVLNCVHGWSCKGPGSIAADQVYFTPQFPGSPSPFMFTNFTGAELKYFYNCCLSWISGYLCRGEEKNAHIICAWDRQHCVHAKW